MCIGDGGLHMVLFGCEVVYGVWRRRGVGAGLRGRSGWFWYGVVG